MGRELANVEGGNMEIENVEASECKLQVQLFGSFDVRINGVPLPPLRSRKVQWLLALLLLRHGQALDRAWLSGVLWPESAPAQALYNLRQSLSNLRHALGEVGHCLHASMVNALSLEVPDADVDVIAFDAAIATGERSGLERAAALYRGPLLEGCAEEWALGERRIREESYLTVLEKLGDMASARGDGSAAIKYARMAIQVDPLRETAQRALIQALAAEGNCGAAVQAYRDLRLLLHKELNAEPDPETSALFQSIRANAQRNSQPRPALQDMARTSSPRRLPSPLTSLVGRSSEMEQVITTLRGARLLTLTGPGGVGKTRLAIAVAEEVAEIYPDGVCFVDLAPLSDPDFIAQTVAAALQVREEPGRSLFATLQGGLQSKTLLLLLDNCEHLLDCCARLANELLRNCPGISILATSQQALGLTGEVVWVVPPLTTPRLPRPGDKAAVKEWSSLLSDYEAVQLFVTRAQQALPAFQMSASNAEAVAQICAHLDGIPLALELAAARVCALSPQEINSKLNQRFRLLTQGSRAALPRQQTLRALMEWSYDLLNASEKALLCRLSVFAGGWTLQAVEEVCVQESREDAEAFEAWEGLDLLTSLVSKSLIMAEQEAGQTRYRLLETVRQYAHDRLTESGEVNLWRTLHRDYFLRLAEEAKQKLSGPEQSNWLQRLEAEHDNLRAALDFCLASPEGAVAGLRLTGALQQFWWTRGHLSEGRHRLEEALNRPQAQEAAPVRVTALSGAGSLAWMQGDYGAARSFYKESLKLGQELGDKQGIAGVLGNLGNVANLQGDYTAARSYFEASLAIKRELGDKRGIANTLLGLGNMAMEQGEYEAARSLGEQSLALGRELEDKRSIARSLINLGNVANLQGDYAAAQPLYEASLEIQRSLGDKRGTARSLTNLGHVAMEQDRYSAARALFEESLALQRELGDREGTSHSLCGLGALMGKQGEVSAAHACLRECLTICQELGEKWVTAHALEGCAELARRQQQAERAIRIYGSAHALRAGIGSPLPPNASHEQERHMTALRKAAGEESFSMAWTQGQSMTLEQAVAYASEEQRA